MNKDLNRDLWCLKELMRTRRRYLGLRQKDAAVKSGVAVNTISKSECGDGVMGLESFLLVVEAYGLKLKLVDKDGVEWKV